MNISTSFQPLRKCHICFSYDCHFLKCVSHLFFFFFWALNYCPIHITGVVTINAIAPLWFLHLAEEISPEVRNAQPGGWHSKQPRLAFSSLFSFRGPRQCVALGWLSQILSAPRPDGADDLARKRQIKCTPHQTEPTRKVSHMRNSV